MTKKEANKKCRIGRFVRLRYEDVGVVDGLIVGRSINHRNELVLEVYEVSSDGTSHVAYGQVVEVGPYLTVPAF